MRVIPTFGITDIYEVPRPRTKNIFWTIFFSKFAVHYLRNGPEDFGSDDIYEVPRPQTIFGGKTNFGPFFSNSRSIISGTDLTISVPMIFMRSPRHQTIFLEKKLQFSKLKPSE